jgi:hypothetical protein
MSMMRAKIQVSRVNRLVGVDGDVIAEEIAANPVCGSAPFGPNGESEDNTFTRFTPSGALMLTVNNPDLLGKFRPGQKFYLDFTEADE